MTIDKVKFSLREIMRLALPLTTTFIAMALMGIIDTIIVGNYQTDQLAYIGLANSVFVVLFTIPIGLLQGVLIKSSQKFGARKFSSCGKIYNEGRRYLIILAVIFTLIGINGEEILKLLGQNEDMVKNGGRVLRVFVFSIPFILVYVNANFFLQSIKRPHIAMYGIIIANVVNVIINPVLVYGKFGFPEMGAVGSATSTLIVRIFLALYMLYYIHKMQKNTKIKKRFGLDRSYSTWWGDSKSTRRIGLGVAVTTLAANGSFSIVSTFAGWMGQHSMATFVIVINITTLMFMICFAISQATSVVVARAYGRRDRDGMASATIAGYIVSISVTSILLTILYNFPDQIFGVFTNDKTVIATINALIVVLMIDVFIDTLPMNAMGSLNGRGDIKIPTIFQIISFLGVRIGAAYILAFPCGLGIAGLIWGFACGGITSFILNGGRLIYLSRTSKIN